MTTKQLSIKVTLSDAASAGLRAVASRVVELGRRAMSVMKGIMAPIAGITKALFSMKTLIGGAFAAFAGGAAFQSLRRAAEEMDELVKTSRQLGLSAQFMSELKYAADLSGVSFEGLSSAAAKASKNIHEAMESGKGRAADTFRELGISLRGAGGQARPMQDVLLDLSDAFNRLDDSYAKVAYSQNIFGKGGTEMLRLLELGRPAIAAMAEEARRLGVVFTDEQLENAEQFNDAISRIGKAWTGIRAKVIGQVGDDMADILNKIASAVAAIPEIIGNAVENVRLMFDPNSEAGARLRATAQDLVHSLGQTISSAVIGIGRVVWASAVTVLEGVWRGVVGVMVANAHIAVQSAFDTAATVIASGAVLIVERIRTIAEIALESVRALIVGKTVSIIASVAEAAVRAAVAAANTLSLAINNVIIRSQIQQQVESVATGVTSAISVVKNEFSEMGDLTRITAEGNKRLNTLNDQQAQSWMDVAAAISATNQETADNVRQFWGVSGATVSFSDGLAVAVEQSEAVKNAMAAMSQETGLWASKSLGLADSLLGVSTALQNTSLDIESINNAIRGVKPALEEVEDAAQNANESLKEGWSGLREGWVTTMDVITKESKNTFELASSVVRSLTVDLSSGLASALVDGISKAKSFGEAIVDVMRDVAKSVAKAIAQFLILRAITGIANSFTGGGSEVNTGLKALAPEYFSRGTSQVKSTRGLSAAAMTSLAAIGVPAYASGISRVPGAYTNRDSTLAMLARDEAVLTPRAASTLGRDRIDHLNRGGSMDGGGMVFAPNITVNVQASPGTDGAQVGRDIGRNLAAELLKELARNPGARAQFRSQLS